MQFLTPQAVNGPTFAPGPLDGSLSVPQLLDLPQSPDHPAYVYDTEDGGIHPICFRRYVPAVHQAARFVIRHLEELSLPQTSPNVIGILAVCDSISMVNAITRAGHIPFVISHRNSVKGPTHLLRVTKTTYVYASPDSPMQALLSGADELLKAENGKAVELLPMPSFEQVQGNVNVVVSLLPEMQRPDDKAIAVILHSSGSTSEISQPISLSHLAYLQLSRLPCFEERDLCGQVMSCHFMGVCLTCWPAGVGLVVAFLRPTSRPISPTPDTVLAGVKATKCTTLFCVPTSLEIWSGTPEGIEMLKSMKVVSFGGAVPSRRVEGVMLTRIYGATEAGTISPYLPLKSNGRDRGYFVLSKHCEPVFVPKNDTALVLGTRLLSFIGGVLKTLFLFTKSDFKTIIAPVLVITLSLNSPSPTLIMQTVFWTWLHVLQCALANQTISPEEDIINKPDRPIPAGRISLKNARLLRWLCIIPCLALSCSYSILVFKASAWLNVFLCFYNELSFNAHWLSRNLLNGAGLACFEIGATLISADEHTHLGPVAVKAITLSAAVFITTIHTQDFKDVLGDKEIGRTTLPILFPKASRISIPVLLFFWSLSLQRLWSTSHFISGLLVTSSIIIGVRFVSMTSVPADQRSFLLYNVWLCFTHLLPAL